MLKAEPNAKAHKSQPRGPGVVMGGSLPVLARIRGSSRGQNSAAGPVLGAGWHKEFRNGRCRAQCQRGPKGGVLATERPRSAPGQARKLRARR